MKDKEIFIVGLANTKRIYLLLAALFILALNADAQDDFAIIKDPDGFTNVREAGVQSKIVGKILKYQPLDCMDGELDYDAGDPVLANMVPVNFFDYVTQKDGYYFRNKVVKTKEGWYDTPSNYGNVYKNRIVRLSTLPRLKLISANDNKAVYAKDSIKVVFEFGKFDGKKHVMCDEKGKQVKFVGDNNAYNITTIDGERIWGTDGEIPHTEIKSVTITLGKTTLALPQSSIKNIFEPAAQDPNTNICMGPDGELYIWMQNSDGAAVYNVIWVIVEKKLKYMLTQLSFYV